MHLYYTFFILCGFHFALILIIVCGEQVPVTSASITEALLRAMLILTFKLTIWNAWTIVIHTVPGITCLVFGKWFWHMLRIRILLVPTDQLWLINLKTYFWSHWLLCFRKTLIFKTINLVNSKGEGWIHYNWMAIYYTAYFIPLRGTATHVY